MKRAIIILAMFFLAVSVISGQETDFSRNAESAIRRGDYADAEKQYVAHKNTLKTIFHKSENDKDFLLAEKKLRKISECAKLKMEAESNISNADEAISGYMKYNAYDALERQSVYDNMRVSYQTILSRLESAKRNLSEICGIFRQDDGSRSRLQYVEGRISGLVAPEDFLKTALFHNPDQRSIDNYLARIKADEGVREQYHKDFYAWQRCLQASDEYSAAKAYLSGSQNILFRKNAQGIVDSRDDADLWNKVDKNSLASVNAYLGRETSYEKAHKVQAERIKKKLEDVAADDRLWSGVNKTDKRSLERYMSTKVNFEKRHLQDAAICVKQINEKEAWAKVDKSSVKAIDTYLSSVRGSGYQKIGENTIDNLLWNSVDHSDYRSVYAYLNSYPKYPKSHKDEAYAEYVRLYDTFRWKSTNHEDRASLLAYLNDADNKSLSHAKEARAYIDILDAHISWNQYRDPIKTYSLLDSAKKYVKLEDDDLALYNEAGDKKSYNDFVTSKSYGAAEAYIRDYPDGIHSSDVRNWLERYHTANEKAEGIIARTYQRTGIVASVHDFESYRQDRYVSNRSFEVSPEGYLRRVREQKRSAIVDAGGHRFRGGFGIGVGYDNYDGKGTFTLNGELRYGNVIQNVNLVAGVNLYMYFSSEESDDEFDSSSTTVTDCSPALYIGPLFHVTHFGSSPTSSRLFISPVLEYDIKDKGIGAQFRVGITLWKSSELGMFYSRRFCNIDAGGSAVGSKGHRYNVIGADLRFNF